MRYPEEGEFLPKNPATDPELIRKQEERDRLMKSLKELKDAKKKDKNEGAKTKKSKKKKKGADDD